MQKTAYKLVDQELKDDLVLKKQIRQSTTKILRRPSFFQNAQKKQSEVSPTVLTALLNQRKEGRLVNSVLEDWVHRFEREFDECNSKNSTQFSEDYIEEQFQKLHAELTNYDTSRLNEIIPQHKILDSGPAKDKLKLRKGNQHLKQDCSSVTSPKLGSRGQASNVIRDQIIKSAEDSTPRDAGFQLGREPNVYSGIQSTAVKTTNNSLPRQFVKKITDSLDRKKNTKTSVEKPENIYEEIPQYPKVEKTPRKGKPKAPVPPSDEYEEISALVAEKSEAVIEVESAAEAIISQSETASVHSTLIDIDANTVPRKKKKSTGPKAPFERFQNCLFTTFTACAPWCLMKKVYWKRETHSEELFAVTARRNSRVRKSNRNSIHQP